MPQFGDDNSGDFKFSAGALPRLFFGDFFLAVSFRLVGLLPSARFRAGDFLFWAPGDLHTSASLRGEEVLEPTSLLQSSLSAPKIIVSLILMEKLQLESD